MCDDVQLSNRCVREFLILARTWFTFGLPSKTGCDRLRPRGLRERGEPRRRGLWPQGETMAGGGTVDLPSAAPSMTGYGEDGGGTVETRALMAGNRGRTMHHRIVWMLTVGS